MSTVLPPAAQRRHPTAAADWDAFRPPGRRPRHAWRLLLHPLTVICAMQAGLSLALVWSNTAFGDEAEYLWLGHLEWAHWLHDATWPSAYAEHVLSGSPVIYPPLGALADSVGGIAGARILSLGFILGATVLLYFTARPLIGPSGAVVATALWALSEPALRLAFATFDPLSVFLTALSAWLIVLGYRRGNAFVVAAAAALALADATAYSGIVIAPVVIAFAFLVWVHRMRARRAILRTACLAGCSGVFFVLLMIASRSWTGLRFTVLYRSVADHQNSLLVLKDIWIYSGLITSLAVVGVFIAVGNEHRQRAALLALLGCAVFIVPAAQLHDRTGWSLDKHLAYGIWFATIAAGYACSRLIRWLPTVSQRLIAICSILALAYPAVNGFEAAWQVYHSWANADSFIKEFRPVAALSRGSIYVAGQERIAQYYTSQGRDWPRWNATIELDPPVRQNQQVSYYKSQLNSGKYGVITLFYPTTFSSAPQLTGTDLLLPSGSRMNQELLRLVGGSREPGLPALTLALEKDPEYKLVYVGQYNSAHVYSAYAIWRKVQN